MQSLLRCATLALLLITSSCSGETASSPAAAGAQGADGARLFQAQGCAVCHGQAGDGTALGPTLHAASQLWNQADLADYLTDPQAWVQKTPRLAALQSRYPAKMQPFRNLAESERRALADFVLSLR